MKKIYILLLLASATIAQTYGQRNLRFGYIDMEYILENVDEYQEASVQLENRVQRWKVELDNIKDEIDAMRLDLSNERALLTNELIEEREEEIEVKEDALRELQIKRFGAKGDYYTQRRRLVQPIQDQVYTIVQELAEARQYDFIFDKTSDTAMLFAAERHDISDLVLRRIDRASNRREATSRSEEKEIDKRESLTDEQDKELTEREKAREAQQSERQKEIERRTRERDSIREARQAEHEARRQQILEERQRQRDSVINARKGNQTDNRAVDHPNPSSSTENTEVKMNDNETSNPAKEETKSEREKIIEDRQEAARKRQEEQRKIREEQIEKRQKERDSIMNARKNRNK